MRGSADRAFRENRRGDVGEELTYRAEAASVPIRFLWPMSCEEAKWHLQGDLISAATRSMTVPFCMRFEIRMPEQQAAFVQTVQRVLAQDAP